ncbi:MAG: hypothetical protein WC828_04440 [Thermoleophilia bacterium]
MKTDERGTEMGIPGIIIRVTATFMLAGVMMIYIIACGDENPATTVSLAQMETNTVPAGSGITSKEPSGGIGKVDWKAEVGAKPMIRDVEEVQYHDFNGDGMDEALVLVRMEGSGAYLDYYIYALENGKPVKLFEKTSVSHGHVDAGELPNSFVETTAAYAPGDPNCCPSQLKRTVYTWAASARVFVETTVETVPNTDS